MAQFLDGSGDATANKTIVGLVRKEKYKMTLSEWFSFRMPIHDMIFNCSGSGKVDMGIYRWPQFGDPVVNEPIGVSVSMTPDIIHTCFKQVHVAEPSRSTPTTLNTQLVNCSFKPANDKNRRGKNPVNRSTIERTLKENGIANKLFGPSEFLTDVVRSKFVVSPEGNGIDTHRAWEAMYFKSIPIIENNDKIRFKYVDLPVIYTEDYSEVTPAYLEEKYVEMRDQVFDFSPLFVSNYDADTVAHMRRRSNHYGNKYQKKEWYPFDYSRVAEYKSIYDDVCMVTITNSGYKQVTKNALESIRRLDIRTNIEVFTLDDGCSQDFIDLGYTTTSLSTDLSMGSKFKDGNWKNITLSKLKVISSVLERYKYVLLFDGDIVFDSGEFLPHMYAEMQRDQTVDLVSQVEFYIDKKSLCTGFMLIQSSAKTREFFSPAQYSEKYGNDQDYVNENRDKLNFVRLPLHLFPNGKYFYEKKPPHPYIIHFNFVSGIQEKVKRMGKYGRWFLGA